MTFRLIIFHVLLFCTCILQSQSIILDEAFSDWEDSRIQTVADLGDSNSGVDIVRLSVTDSRDFIYFLVEFDREIQLQDNNNYTIQIVNNGVSLFFNFGDKRGTLNGNLVFHNDLNLVASPTVTSTIFEIQIFTNC